MNKVVLSGRLTADPELKSTQSGVSNTRFCLAVSRKFKNDKGGYDADFVYCTAWRGLAEFICKYFKRGSMIIVSGSLQTSSWEGADGKTKYKTEIVLEEADFTGSADTSTAPSYIAPAINSPSVTSPATDNFDIPEFSSADDDDLPW